MGQTPSKDQQLSDLYSSYIQQQQNLIHTQQMQINELFMNNLQSQMNMTPNMIFQNMQQQLPQQQYSQQQLPQQQLPQQQYSQQQLPQLEKQKTKLDPYKILDISKNYDEKTLKKAYLKAAMKYHPDRGGSAIEFQKVSIAYTLLTNKLKENNNNHSHNELRDNLKDFMNTQNSNPKINIKMTENFDIDVFNKIYEENKISDVYDEGYGDWMNETSNETNQPKMFQNGFNKDMFNSVFEQYKSEKQKQNAIVQYKEPEENISMNNKHSIMNLGQGKITDFGGQTNNLCYTDYKQAFTDGSTLIDASSVDISDRAQSINGIKSQRSNISYTMSEKDSQLYAMKQLEEKKNEEKRLQRLNVYDQKHSQAYEKIHSLLLR